MRGKCTRCVIVAQRQSSPTTLCVVFFSDSCFASLCVCAHCSARLWDDGVIKPKDSRTVLGLALAASRHNPGGPSKFGVFRM